MSFLYGKKDPLDVLPDQKQQSAVPTLQQNFDAAQQSAYVGDQSVSKGRLLQQQWEPLIEEINARNDGIPFPNPADVYLENALSGIVMPSMVESFYQQDADEIIKHINENPDLYPDLYGITTEGLLENAKIEALALRRQYEEAADKSPGFMAGAARFGGAVFGTVDDPVLLYSMAQTRGGSLAASLTGVMFREAAIGAGTEAIIQTSVKDWYESLGLDYTWEDFATNVAIGGVFGAGAPLVFKIGGDTINLTADQARKGYEALVDSGAFAPKGTTRAAEQLRDAQTDIADANPLVNEDAHQERLKQAALAVENNRAPAISDEPPVDVKVPDSVYDADNLDGLIYRFDPAEIQVDAETFQFKSGGDEFGVSERLQDVTQWNPALAGQVTVYEYADGSKFIADGHQRLGLAKRIMSQDPSQDVRLYGQILREVDGHTPAMARVSAAIKNISEGTGTAIDAAKVLRVAPDRVIDLPPRSALVRQAQQLVYLDDDAFGAVINGLIPANYGAVVGRLIPDNPGLQKNAIDILAKSDPANEFQAEAIVRQVREAGFEQREQVGLFGEEVITESYFTERARILDRTQKALRQDKNAFGSLVNNADRLAAEGNILAKNANQRRAENDAQALALLQALANKVGPLSDALTAAARQARETGSYTEPTRGFIDAVRSAIESGDFQRIGAGDVGRPFHDPTQSSVRPDQAEPELEGFDDASGAAAARQADQLTEDMLGGLDEVEADPALRSPVEEDNAPLEEIRMPIDDALPNDQIRAQVQALTQENVPIIKGLIDRIDSKFGTESGDNVKDLAKVIQKANRPSIIKKKPWHKVSHIRDSYRFKTVIEDFRDVPAIFDELLAEGISLVKIDTQKLFKPKEWGWRIIAFDLRMPNGQLVEWYLPIKELEAQKKGRGHAIFEEWRNKTDDEIAEQWDNYQAAIRESYEGYDDAFQASLDRLGVSREAAEASWTNAERAISEAASKSIKSSAEMTSSAVRGLETQVPSNVRSTDVPLSRKSQALEVPGSTKANVSAINPPEDSVDDLIPDINLDDEIPFDLQIDENGEVVSQTMTLRQLKEEIDQDQAMLDRLEGCVR